MIEKIFIYVNSNREDDLDLCSIEMNLDLGIRYRNSYYNYTRREFIVSVICSEEALEKLKCRMGI